MWICTLLLIGIILNLFITLFIGALPAIKTFGLSFISATEWIPYENKYGAGIFLIGTAITSVLALIISIPTSLSLSLLLGHYLKKGYIRNTLTLFLDIGASIPSVIYGFWGIKILFPHIQNLQIQMGMPPYGASILSATLILSMMILPYSVSLGKQTIAQTSKDLKENAFALGATSYEMIQNIILPQAKSGILSGCMLALCRAIGETLAVTMLIGNSYEMPQHLLSPGSTFSSLLINEFSMTSDPMHNASLLYIALILIVSTSVFTALSKGIAPKKWTFR